LTGPGQTPPVLTKRQLQVLTRLAKGQLESDIAAALGIGRRTVRMHIDTLRVKLGVSRRGEIFSEYRRLGGQDLLADHPDSATAPRHDSTQVEDGS
jgi:DNA-binding CsgD family transcriptional regulator